jgi:hypothetical protein
MNRIANILNEHFNETPFGLQDIIDFLTTNETIRYEIFKQKQHEFYKEDVEYTISEYNEDNDTHHIFTDDEIENMTYRYDDCLGDYSNWHEILYNIVSDWCDDKN